MLIVDNKLFLCQTKLMTLRKKKEAYLKYTYLAWAKCGRRSHNLKLWFHEKVQNRYDL